MVTDEISQRRNQRTESIDELGSAIIGLAGRLASATCRWLLLVAEFDARNGCATFGLGSTARWLSHTCGLSLRTAIDHVRVARALAEFPALAQAMSTGRLSYSHVRAISRVPAAGEHQSVADLVEVAEHGSVSQLEVVVRGLRTVESADNLDGPAGRLVEEYVSHSWSADSRWRLSAGLDPERGALVQAALERISAGEQISPAAALVRLAEIALAAANDSAMAPRDLRSDERAAVIVHVNAADVPAPDEREHATTAGRSDQRPQRGRYRPWGRIADGPGLPDSVLTRLLCGGRVRTVLHKADGSVADLGRSQRIVSAKLFRLLLLRDGGCAHPGCGSRRKLEAHHVRYWIHGGPTDLANLVLLCCRHHHAHHDGEFYIGHTAEQGRFRFRRADGAELVAQVDPTDHIVDDGPLEDEHADVAATAAFTRSAGDRLDRQWAISVLAERRQRHRPQRAG